MNIFPLYIFSGASKSPSIDSDYDSEEESDDGDDDGDGGGRRAVQRGGRLQMEQEAAVQSVNSVKVEELQLQQSSSSDTDAPLLSSGESFTYFCSRRSPIKGDA